jgi:hypothetical protein
MSSFFPVHDACRWQHPCGEERKRTHADISSSQSSYGSPPRKTPRMATVPYPATSEEHRELDQVVLNKTSVKFLWDTDINKGVPATFLLSAIVKLSPNLDQTYTDFDEAYTLIEQNTFLADELKEAWGNKSFASIRNLGQPPFSSDVVINTHSRMIMQVLSNLGSRRRCPSYG